MRAETIANALGGRKMGCAWMARCPAHEDRKPSLCITDGAGGKLLVRCHAGCEQRDVIAALSSRGLWEAKWRHDLRQVRGHQHRRIAEPDHDSSKRTQAALSIWRESRPTNGTPVEEYLRSRGLKVPESPAIRFHPGLKHPSGGVWPAMVALVTRGVDRAPIAIHRTFLAPDGSGKASIEPEKMMLGPCRGGAVGLAEPGDVLMIGEGIETCLAAMQATGNPAWAALSTSGLCNLDLPNDVRDVIVLADGDDPGESAARKCALRWKQQGRRVRIARPPEGLDFNDMLMGLAPSNTEDTR